MAALGAVAAFIGAAGSVLQGVAANNQAQYQAEQERMQGKEEFASSQRDADAKRKESQLVQSRQQALAASSGGGADDPTIIKLMTETAAQGEYNAQASLYGGENRKRGLFDQAKGTEMSGQASLLGGFLAGAGQIASGFAKLPQDTKTKLGWG